MVFGDDKNEKLLAQRLLNASRFHPLLMDRLAKLAADAKLRLQLLQALDTLAKTKDFARLPELFATTPGDAKELAYLDDALAVSLDQLIRDASPDARRVLWMIAVANKPVALDLLKSVWSGEDSPRQEQLRQIKQMLDMLPLLPPETQEKLKAMPPELRAMLDALIPYLQTAAESASEGKLRWSCLCYLADALRNGGRPDASMPFYEQAATLARAAAEAGGKGAREAWAALAAITENSGFALRNVGDLDGARQSHVDSAEAEFLARAFIGALDIARQADYARWSARENSWSAQRNRSEAVGINSENGIIVQVQEHILLV